MSAKPKNLERRRVSIIRDADDGAKREQLPATAEERLDLLWEVTKAAMQWTGDAEPRVQRSVCRIQRSRR